MRQLVIDIQNAGYVDEPKVIENIQFTLLEGEFVGLIGANGAGKSTTMKAMMGLLPKFNGTTPLSDIRYAYVPEQPIFYDEWTLFEHLNFAASAFSLNDWEKRGERLLERFQLAHVKHHFVTSFSKGMQQKFMLVLAFLLKPDLFIIDEPFVGLDPRSTKELLQMLAEEKDRGATIFMSTHVLDTAERICDRFLLLADGTLLAEGTLAQLRTQSGLLDGSLLDCFDGLLEGSGL